MPPLGVRNQCNEEALRGEHGRNVNGANGLLLSMSSAVTLGVVKKCPLRDGYRRSQELHRLEVLGSGVVDCLAVPQSSDRKYPSFSAWSVTCSVGNRDILPDDDCRLR